jgi:prepilin-type N-terminal cleavage/methylation domain-containing protein
MRPTSQTGFTLVELSIVLVVVGLIIGSILIAVSILQNARVTNAENALRSIQSAVSTYNQNYSALPGDDVQAKTRFGAGVVSNQGGGDGTIGASTLEDTFQANSAAADGNGASESTIIWSHLRAASLVKGPASSTSAPSNPFGGVIGVQNGAFNADGLSGNVVCMSKVTGDAAKILDSRFDDGIATTGKMRGGTSITGAASEYTNSGTFVVCTPLF